MASILAAAVHNLLGTSLAAANHLAGRVALVDYLQLVAGDPLGIQLGRNLCLEFLARLASRQRTTGQGHQAQRQNQFVHHSLSLCR